MLPQVSIPGIVATKAYLSGVLFISIILLTFYTNCKLLLFTSSFSFSTMFSYFIWIAFVPVVSLTVTFLWFNSKQGCSTCHIVQQKWRTVGTKVWVKHVIPAPRFLRHAILWTRLVLHKYWIHRMLASQGCW